MARPVGLGQKTPGEHGSSLGVRNDGAPASINSLVTGKGGDDRLTLIWSHGSADLIPQDRRLAFASGAELARGAEPHSSSIKKKRMGGAPAETTRGSRDRLKGQP
jgi:hypothetical protein